MGALRLVPEHDMIVCARNGSPLILGQGEGESFVSSDPMHYLNTLRMFLLEDMAVITRDRIDISRLKEESLLPV